MRLGIRDKLIGIFVLIKVIPLVVLAWFAWNEISALSGALESHVNQMAKTSTYTTKAVAGLATSSSIRALDIRSREAIEQLTTSTARYVADFLKARDCDIQTAALLTPDPEKYHAFINAQEKEIILHEPWVMSPDKNKWEPKSKAEGDADPGSDSVRARNRDNELDFHYRMPGKAGINRSIPLYLEMTYVDLLGKEKIKVTTSDLMSGALKDVSKKDQTFCRAETYFEHLKTLSPGQIYVSDVIGAYVKTHMIGSYTPQRARDFQVDFKPELSGYAGKENPVGKRFKGLIRWATPVVVDNKITGYVTLALDHTHVMEFTDHIVPTSERFSSISDASSGNYAFMWDHKGRNISHPRDYFITGYDPSTGDYMTPWLEKNDYEKYDLSDTGIEAFLATLPEYDNQSLSKLASQELVKKGLVGLDCRYLNFAPQCDGWNNLTQFGGSGSFVIHWSGLKKLTTAATIPYYTGQYGKSPRGFGFVTIGANVFEFHKPAMLTAQKISKTERQFIRNIEEQTVENRNIIATSLNNTAIRLTLYTLLMVACVIAIAVLMASTLTGKITSMINGISIFQKGNMNHRLEINSSDEMGKLENTFNSMADTVQQAILELETSKSTVEDSNVSLKNMLSRIIDSMPSVIIGVDTRFKITLWNDEAVKMTGKSFEQLEGKDLFETFPLLSRTRDLLAKSIEQGEIKKDERVEVMMENGRMFFDMTAYPLISKQVDGTVLRVDNITQRVYMEEMMVQTEKMQSIGGLAAGMAHEINNPLAGIIQSAQVIKNRTKTDMPKNVQVAKETGVDLEKLGDYFEKRQIVSMLNAILDAGRRAADIVSNMLAFSRKSSSTFELNSIDKILGQTIDIIHKDYDLKKDLDFKKINIEQTYDPNLKELCCDSGKIQQVFFNILKNAAHAMMASPSSEPHGIKVAAVQEESTVRICISDNGPGMTEEIKNRIFEPFFTTKSVGVGTGLGLYVSYFIIVENHNGTITVDSSPGKGTSFTITLPLSQPA